MKHRKLRRYFRHGTLTQLSVFEAVARHSSFTRAAEELHIAQPTVSVQVKKLAATIGLPLFEMIGKRVQMTAAGRELYAAVQEIFSGIGRVEDRLARLRAPAAGPLRIAAGTSAIYLAQRILERFVAGFPGVDVSLTVRNREQLLARLAADVDDFYILSSPSEAVQVALHPLLPNPASIFAHRGHPLAARRRVRFADVAREPFLMRETGSGTRLAAERLFASHGITPSVPMELDSNQAIGQAIAARLGLSLLSHHAVDPPAPRSDIVALDVEGLPIVRWWYLMYPAGKRLSATGQAFLEEVTRPGALNELGPVRIGHGTGATAGPGR